MSKRADGKFERRDLDIYPTPYAAVLALIPHLRTADVRTFAEPCVGPGDLRRHLESFGFTCVYEGDVVTGQDALATSAYGEPDVIVTNPPFRRSVLHPMIRHFERIAPTWLLLEWDWLATQQATPFLDSCSDIVIVGRLKLIPDSPDISLDNFCWLRFDSRHRDGPKFHPFRMALARPKPDNRPCAHCAGPFRGRRGDARFCCNGCRQAAHRARAEP